MLSLVLSLSNLFQQTSCEHPRGAILGDESGRDEICKWHMIFVESFTGSQASWDFLHIQCSELHAIKTPCLETPGTAV